MNAACRFCGVERAPGNNPAHRCADSDAYQHQRQEEGNAAAKIRDMKIAGEEGQKRQATQDQCPWHHEGSTKFKFLSHEEIACTACGHIVFLPDEATR